MRSRKPYSISRMKRLLVKMVILLYSSKKHWDIIGKDFITVVRYFFDSYTLPRCVNATRTPNFLKKFLKFIFFYVFRSFWCADVKNNLKKNIILMHLQAKSTLKNNYYHTLKHTLRLLWFLRLKHPPLWINLDLSHVVI